MQEKDGYVLLAGIESPGLSASPAIAERVVEMLGYAGAARKTRVVRRKPYPDVGVAVGDDAKVGHADPARNIVCQCENVVESTVVGAIHAVPGPTSTDGVKWRTRCGMGECQGARCRPRVEALLERELATPAGKRPSLAASVGERVLKRELSRL